MGKLWLLFIISSMITACDEIEPVSKAPDTAYASNPSPVSTNIDLPIITETEEPTELDEPIDLKDEHSQLDKPVDDKPNYIDEPTINEPLIDEPTNTERKPIDTNLPNKQLGWYFNRNKNHQPPTAQKDIDLSKYNAYYLGDIESQVIYLTFDQGYENGYTASILDTLKEKNVKATFFLTKPYIKSNPELVKRMVDEGHICANHSVTHKSSPVLSNDELIDEIEETARYFQEITGAKMSNLFRPPSGEYSERTLAITNSIDYKTIFWSFAYQDWLVDKQPGKAVAYKTVMDNLHNGCIMLLHSVSSSNTEALPEIIDSIHELGYSFKGLNELN